ncbi:MAG: radical SAM protein [Zetaproteobacteria bacterium CG_4_9_14_3_um_filter_49_83]|nr:MAG: radical SAM protein [Zetaproteobacteria bacterium CG1_02_49_23]PIQ31898.1 MAG: radical SAM protein [Zetaproteobacteria bacterium CG17_big_fil_post_rev_8_21_14_2_50_50_13]PIV30457.1 MAG: radical SAM protein [Zetaproteobacteria bacterium CG02_land_8_20_14_3_00_50_9]PIY55431.1 MAG: radical SAM protein [Zetaproteobacteria bacterium CG_4_10_14_0_8_um_filter_49_80]PJA34589.1 MAG: radical SAM protein [Zetaproteobacteria bacterium CG_4_9_14_3_um_filter_49_83]
MTYVYPVISRRAGGVSVGINLNPNNACNWRCVYCQVPDLVRGSSPEIDMVQLEAELVQLLGDIMQGSFLQDHVPEGVRVLRDVAISGNGEPTSCKAFDAVVQRVVRVMGRFEFDAPVPLRLITNGSYMTKSPVQRGLQRMRGAGGEVWIKVDSATTEGLARINGVSMTSQRLFEQVRIAAQCCPTWIQTCMFADAQHIPDAHEVDAYLSFLEMLKLERVPIEGVLLYGLARPSMQGEGKKLHALDQVWMQAMAAEIVEAGMKVRLSE